MKIIKVKNEYYNLAQYQSFFFGPGIFRLDYYIGGKNYDKDNTDNDDLSMSSEVIFRILNSSNQIEFQSKFDTFLTSDAKMIDFSSDLEFNNGTVIENSTIDLRMFNAAILIIESGQGSASLIQRKMQLDYNTAGRIVDQLEELGIIGPFEGTNPRKVFFNSKDALQAYLSQKGIEVV
jgi:DNA segregation ATPase FtsK/SpoIIIE-like protein